MDLDSAARFYAAALGFEARASDGRLLASPSHIAATPRRSTFVFCGAVGPPRNWTALMLLPVVQSGSAP